MRKTDNSPTPDNQIRKDKMKLTVTNIYPSFQKKSEQETRQEIATLLRFHFSRHHFGQNPVIPSYLISI